MASVGQCVVGQCVVGVLYQIVVTYVPEHVAGVAEQDMLRQLFGLDFRHSLARLSLSGWARR